MKKNSLLQIVSIILSHKNIFKQIHSSSKPPVAQFSPIEATTDGNVDILNNTATANSSTSGMIARIMDDALETNGTADDEDDAGSVELTTPRLETEERAVNKSERIVTR